MRYLLIILLFTSCSFEATVTSVPKGTYADGIVRYKVDNVEKSMFTNVYVKDTKLRVGNIVKIKKTTIIKIIK